MPIGASSTCNRPMHFCRQCPIGLRRLVRSSFSQACETAGALGLLTRSFRWWAAVMLALYAACVFPANVKHAFENVQLPQLPSSWWYHGPRLALQPIIIWWSLYSGGVVSWPFGRGLGMPGHDIR